MLQTACVGVQAAEADTPHRGAELRCDRTKFCRRLHHFESRAEATGTAHVKRAAILHARGKQRRKLCTDKRRSKMRQNAEYSGSTG
eukprot:6175594-Pleurochrysis_carterae.AAC.1